MSRSSLRPPIPVRKPANVTFTAAVQGRDHPLKGNSTGGNGGGTVTSQTLAIDSGIFELTAGYNGGGVTAISSTAYAVRLSADTA